MPSPYFRPKSKLPGLYSDDEMMSAADSAAQRKAMSGTVGAAQVDGGSGFDILSSALGLLGKNKEAAVPAETGKTPVVSGDEKQVMAGIDNMIAGMDGKQSGATPAPTEEKSFFDSLTDEDIMLFGLAMAANSKPGTGLLEAAGAGGVAALGNRQKNRLFDAKQNLAMAKYASDADYKSQQLEMSKERVALARQRAANAGGGGVIKPTSAMQNYQFLISKGVDPKTAQMQAFGGGAGGSGVSQKDIITLATNLLKDEQADSMEDAISKAQGFYGFAPEPTEEELMREALEAERKRTQGRNPNPYGDIPLQLAPPPPGY